MVADNRDAILAAVKGDMGGGPMAVDLADVSLSLPRVE